MLVTDGEQRSALAVVRSLGRAGYRVSVAAARRPSLAGASRWAVSQHLVPDSLHEPAAYVEAVAALVSVEEVDLLLPVTDASLLAILGAKDLFRDVSLPFPDIEAFLRAADKRLVLERARAVGIATPEQRTVATPDEAAMLPWHDLSYPIVLKPSRSVSSVGTSREKYSVSHIGGPEELRAAFAMLPAEAFPVLLQDRIVGPGVGIFLLLWGGEVRAAFSHRRLREKPPSGGVSVYRESIPLDSDLLERSRGLLDSLGFEGVAMVEYKLDHVSATPYLMEVNGRFWGSLQLAVDAGADFPRILAELASGVDPGPMPEYECGVRSRWWWGDVDHLLARLTKSPKRLALPDGEPGRLEALLDFVKFFRPGDRNEVLRWSDPRPFVRETLDWLRGR